MSDKRPWMIHQCEYIKAARVGLEKTTFHAVLWLLESVALVAKVENVPTSFLISPFHFSVGGHHLLRGRLRDYYTSTSVK